MKLVFEHNHLELQCDPKIYGKPLFIDFNQERYKVVSRKELLLKAIGIKKDYLPSVVDLSAGLGSDAYLLYRAGCQLQLVERSPIIAALLEDGLKRAQCELAVYKGEAKDFLQQCIKEKYHPDVIYFDPIFPEKNNTALARKSARLLRAIVGEDHDAAEVFALAMKVAKKRVVIKRPLQGCPINDVKPDIVFKGKSIRFDVYIKNAFL